MEHNVAAQVSSPRAMLCMIPAKMNRFASRSTASHTRDGFSGNLLRACGGMS